MCKRKIAASFLTVVCALLFAACGSNAANGADAQEAAAIPRQKDPASKAIVVYYSATGRTKEAAEAVAAAVRADRSSIGMGTVSYTHLTLPTTPYV